MERAIFERKESASGPQHPAPELVAACFAYLTDQVNKRPRPTREHPLAQPPIFEAIRSRRADLVRLFLSAGADPNLIRDDGRTPMNAAVGAGFVEAALLLLGSPDLDPVANFRHTFVSPIQTARAYGRREFEPLLTDPGVRSRFTDLVRSCDPRLERVERAAVRSAERTADPVEAAIQLAARKGPSLSLGAHLLSRPGAKSQTLAPDISLRGQHSFAMAATLAQAIQPAVTGDVVQVERAGEPNSVSRVLVRNATPFEPDAETRILDFLERLSATGTHFTEMLGRASKLSEGVWGALAFPDHERPGEVAIATVNRHVITAARRSSAVERAILPFQLGLGQSENSRPFLLRAREPDMVRIVDAARAPGWGQWLWDGRK